MSKRYYLADIIGTGEADVDDYRPAVADYPVNWVGSFPVNLQTGTPLKSWTMVMVETANHAQLLSDPRIDPLPDWPLDGKVSGINTVTKNAMLTAMAQRGISTAAVAGTDGYREIIRMIGTEANATFDENAFDVG